MAEPANIESDFNAGPLYYNKNSNYNSGQNAQSQVGAFLQALAQRESGGEKDPYTAVGTKTKSGDRAYGKYQIMGNNIPAWTKQYLGKSMTVQQFVANPQAQDQLMQKRALDLYKQYGSWANVASVHFSGKPADAPGVSGETDANGTSTSGYVQSVLGTFNKILGGGTANADTTSDPTMQGIAATDPVGSATGSSSSGLTQDQLQQNIQAMQKQGGTQQQIQSYIDTLSKNSDGTYAKPGSSPAAGSIPAGQQTVQYDPSNEGMGQFMTDFLTAQPQSVVDTAKNVGSFIGQSLEDIPRVGATAGAGVMTAGEELAGNKNAPQDVAASMNKNPTALKPFDNAYDWLGGLLNTASWAVGGPEDAASLKTAAQGAESEVLPAFKGVAAKTSNLARTMAHPFFGGMNAKGALGFSALQGASTAAKAKGQGATDGSAAGQGVVAGLGSLATLAGLGAGAWGLGKFADVFSRTSAAKYTTQMFQGAIETMQHAITDGMRSDSAKSVITAVNEASKQFAGGMKNVFNTLSKKSGGMFNSLPEARMAVNDLVGNVYDNLKPMRSSLRQGFDDMFKNAPALTMDSDGGKAVMAAFNDAKNSAGQKVFDTEQEEALATARGETGASLSPTLSSYLGRFALDVIAPLQKDGQIPMKVLDDVIHYLPPSGSPTEQAVGSRLQDALYNAFGDNLKAKDPELFNNWQKLRSNFQALSSTWDGKFKKVFTGANDPESIANRFIDGDLIKSPTDTDIVTQILGKKGMQSLLSYVNKTLTERAGRLYEGAIGVGTPAALESAKSQVTGLFDKTIEKLSQGNSDYGEFVPAEMLNMWQQMRDLASNDVWALGKTAADSGVIDSKGFQALQDMYKNLQGAPKAFAAAIKSPATMAENIIRMAPEEIASTKQLLSGKTITAKDGSSVPVWDVVSGNVLKNLLSDIIPAFGNISDQDAVAGLRSKLESLGGSNKNEVLDTILGSQVTGGLKDLFNALDYAKSTEGKGGAAARGVAHGAASAFFAIIHHPMFSVGEARQSISAFSSLSQSELEKDFLSNLERKGKLPTKILRSAASVLRNILKSYPLQQVLPRASENALDPTIQGGDTSQASQ